MTSEEQPEVLSEVRAALEHEPRVNLHRYPLVIDRDDAGALILEGETESIAAKKVALEVAASTPGVTGIVDRLRVAPARRMGDGEIRDHVRDALLAEPAFAKCAIRIRAKGRWDTVREPAASDGDFFEASVEDGIVTLNGTVKSLSHKALGGALAWWVPGSRDVVNRIEVDPPQPPDDSETREAVGLVLQKDPLVDAGAIRVIARNSVVVLEGYVASGSERDMAEMDAWYVIGVDLVINRLEVRQ
ncbi:MAG: BON domain-containing protein [Candidatus Binataceae bacterium]